MVSPPGQNHGGGDGRVEHRRFPRVPREDEMRARSLPSAFSQAESTITTTVPPRRIFSYCSGADRKNMMQQRPKAKQITSNEARLAGLTLEATFYFCNFPTLLSRPRPKSKLLSEPPCHVHRTSLPSVLHFYRTSLYIIYFFFIFYYLFCKIKKY